MSNKKYDLDNQHLLFTFDTWQADKSSVLGYHDWVVARLAEEQRLCKADAEARAAELAKTCEGDDHPYNVTNPHPEYLFEDWNFQATHGDTVLSYKDWVTHMIESNKVQSFEVAEVPEPYKLTAGEAKCLHHLREAWESWVHLKHEHPDAVNEFRHALHQCQYLVGIRQACRVDRDTWVQR